MREWLPFIVAGLTNGSIYGLAAVGLVLTYKTSGIFNFGHGVIPSTDPGQLTALTEFVHGYQPR